MGVGGDGTTMIIAAFVEGIKTEKKEKQPAVTRGWLSWRKTLK